MARTKSFLDMPYGKLGYMPFTKKEYRKFGKESYPHFILGGDVGGTNTNLGIFGVKSNKNSLPVLLTSFHFKNRELKGLHSAVNAALGYIQENHKIKVNSACFGIAGALSHDRNAVKITNGKWNVTKKSLSENTALKQIIFINDFEAVGFGINMLGKKDILVVKKAKKIPKAPMLVIGAGTGLGKATLVYNEHYNAYASLPSEAGHSDFPAQSTQELELINFIRQNKRIQSIPYEEVLSGRGLANIYSFLRKNLKKGGKSIKTEYTNEIDKAKNKPELISKYRRTDETCKAAFTIFKTIYARFAKNFAIDSLAFGGVYIAGGIAPKNRGIFDKEFIRGFEQNEQLAHVLNKIPIYLILNYNVGLLGAGFFGGRVFKRRNR